jgi:hypothetical protein
MGFSPHTPSELTAVYGFVVTVSVRARQLLYYPDDTISFLITTGSSIQTITLTVSPHYLQISTSTSNTRFKRCAHVIDALRSSGLIPEVRHLTWPSFLCPDHRTLPMLDTCYSAQTRRDNAPVYPDSAKVCNEFIAED